MGIGKRGRGVRAQFARCLIWRNEPLQPDFDAKEDKQTDVGNEPTEDLHLSQTRFYLNRPGTSFPRAAFEPG